MHLLMTAWHVCVVYKIKPPTDPNECEAIKQATESIICVYTSVRDVLCLLLILWRTAHETHVRVLSMIYTSKHNTQKH